MISSVRPDAAKSALLLREARLRAGLSQAALAERSEVHRVQINRYEAGAVVPSLDTLLELVNACGFDVPLELVPRQPAADDVLSELQQLSPERRLERMLRGGTGGAAAAPSSGRSFDPRRLLAALERNYVDYVVIGGLARVLRGAEETTDGIDICPSFSAGNLDRLTAALHELDSATPESPGERLTEDSLERQPVLALPTASGSLQIVAVPTGAPNGFVDLRRAATREDLGRGLRPPVASTSDLARLAAALGREQDLKRLADLRRAVELEINREQTLSSTPRAPAAPQRDRLPRRTSR
jgi:transcriptional regulator with XRE-family HTH domain